MDTPDIAQIQRAVGERYEVVDLAGAGGMGVVYRARHNALGHYVAIKVLPPEVAESGMRQERFKREASLAAHLSHPNIVPVFEFEQRAGVSYLIMPFVRGHSLDSVLAAGTRLAPVDVMRVLIDIGAALDFVHPRGVIHRDVKPANIMIEDESGRALLTDFGVAYVTPTTSDALTAVGSAIGTPDYMAPEQALGRRIDGRADLYALAIVAYEALTGTLPMLSVSPDAPARALHTARPEIAPRLAAALMAPLAQEPGDRPASAAQWLAQIKHASSGARRQAALLGTVVVAALLVVGKIALGRHEAAAVRPSVAVMPFAVLFRGLPPYPVERLPDFFMSRFSAVPELSDQVSFEQVLLHTGPHPVDRAKADSVAHLLGTKYFLNTVSFDFQADSVTLNASLYETGREDPLAAGLNAKGPVGSLPDVMDDLWAKILAVVGGVFSRNAATIPHGKDAIAAYLYADDAFMRGDYNKALALYDSVTHRDPDFAPAYLRRVLVLAQVAPNEDSLLAAMSGARPRTKDLTPSDSLLLDGYIQLVQHGDGEAALESFRAATSRSAGNVWARFALGEFYYYFGQLFDIDHSLDSARAAFDSVRALYPHFAAAIANSISIAHQHDDDEEAQRLIGIYRDVDSISVVAEVIGLADTLLFHKQNAPNVLNTLNRHKFTVLEYLAFQAAQAGSDADRQVPARRVLAALERRATTEYERALALRVRLAADLREGWTDSARAKLKDPAANAAERDAWLVLAPNIGLPSLGDAVGARQRLAAPRESDATRLWLLGISAANSDQQIADLGRLARASSPLPMSLKLDLEARALLASGDTMAALSLWDQATRRYAVLQAPVGLVASLWPLRRDLAILADARNDTTRAVRACRSFDALVGFVDQVVWREMQQLCEKWNNLSAR